MNRKSRGEGVCCFEKSVHEDVEKAKKIVDNAEK